jgi:hypothetical protein
MSNLSFLGVDEQQQGWVLSAFNPTDYDTALTAMVIDINKQYPGITNTFKRMDLMGIAGGPLEKFLYDYIEAGHAMRTPYTGGNYQKFYDYFKTHWGKNYDDEELDIYLNTLLRMHKMGKIPTNIYKPYTYQPSEGGQVSQAATVIASTAKKAAFGAGSMIIVGTIAYFLLKDKLFGTSKKKR